MTAPTRPRTPAAARRPAPAPAAPTPTPARRPPLAVVDERSLRSVRRRRAAVVAVVGILVLALFGVGLVHAQLVQRQQHLDQLRAEIAETQAHRLRLYRDVVVASSPDEVVRRATEMGMVRAEDPVYLVAVRPVGAG
jgi:uncharacterized protein HemX